MEDSKLYCTQDIEKLKQKIEAYKDTLTSLKTGTSIEDYLFMKMDFDGIKTQMALLEGLTETIDVKPNSQTGSYDEQIKLLSAQIESLNQTIEEMNLEILKVLNKLLTTENTEATTTTPKTENTSKSIANGVQSDPIITQTTSQSAVALRQPSYKMLQSLAGKARNAQLDVNNGIPSAHNGNQRNVPEDRHFNQQYFQSINTHPNQIYNGLYRNTTTESTIHLKNATYTQEIPISVYESNTLPNVDIHNSTDNDLNSEGSANYRESEDINNTVTLDGMSSVIANEPSTPVTSEIVNEPSIPVTSEVVNETINTPIILEAADTVNAPVIPEAADTDDAPAILEATDTVNAPVILEAADTINAPVIPEAANAVNEQGDINKSPILKSDEFEIFEPTSEEVYETHTPIEDINKQPEQKEESAEEGHKKEKGSLFFNFFRKWS
ncbi:hypothetical protein [Lysinibacillus xylanilyticus]|uniref:Uncharacterized protein n=1 Tax=Lysinibacillus xylanilyticus TaxID=582475 RepID=A0ABT4EXK6_9BACI|nr:hypothetical protein [Lysinibacillus xylanilyticus]MCY9549216.1 hypothetical protein [Lysinibacillus xylanilyticus]